MFWIYPKYKWMVDSCPMPYRLYGLFLRWWCFWRVRSEKRMRNRDRMMHGCHFESPTTQQQSHIFCSIFRFSIRSERECVVHVFYCSLAPICVHRVWFVSVALSSVQCEEQITQQPRMLNLCVEYSKNMAHTDIVLNSGYIRRYSHLSVTFRTEPNHISFVFASFASRSWPNNNSITGEQTEKPNARLNENETKTRTFKTVRPTTKAASQTVFPPFRGIEWREFFLPVSVSWIELVIAYTHYILVYFFF